MAKLLNILIGLVMLLIAATRGVPLEEKIDDDLKSAETYAFGYFSNPHMYSNNAMDARGVQSASNSRMPYVNEAIIYVPEEFSFIAAVIPVAAASTPDFGSNGLSSVNHINHNQILMPIASARGRSYSGYSDYGRTSTKYNNRQMYGNGIGNGIEGGYGWNNGKSGLNTEQYYRKSAS